MTLLVLMMSPNSVVSAPASTMKGLPFIQSKTALNVCCTCAPACRDRGQDSELIRIVQRVGGPSCNLPFRPRDAGYFCAGNDSSGALLLPLDRPAIMRKRQAEIFAQRLAFVFATEQAAALQLGDEQLDDVLQPARKGQRQNVEAVGR